MGQAPMGSRAAAKPRTCSTWPNFESAHAMRNRVIKAATFEFAHLTQVGETDDLIEYHRLPPRAGSAMTTVAYCAVSPADAPAATRSGCACMRCRDCAGSPRRYTPRGGDQRP